MKSDLVLGLVGENHRDQYLNDAEFHSRIELLARMLPSWVDGIAAECDALRVERDAALFLQEYEKGES